MMPHDDRGHAYPYNGREHLRLAIPMALQQAGLQIMGAVDVAVLGRYHTDALAGAGVANSLIWAISCVGMGVLMGLDSMLPQALGQGRPELAHRAYVSSQRLAWQIAIITVAACALAPLALTFSSASPAVQTAARDYTLLRALGVLPFLLSVPMRAYLTARGDTTILLWATILGNLVNGIADWVLVFGDEGLSTLGLPPLGLPRLGVLGAGLATALVQLVTWGLFAWRLRRVNTAYAASVTPSTDDRRELRRLGTPIGLQLLAEVGIFALTALLAADLSASAASAHQVAIALASFSFSLAVGIGSATATVVGRAKGAGATERLRALALRGVLMGLSVMGVSAVVFRLAAAPLAGLFTNKPEVLALAVPLLTVAAVFQLSDGIQAILAGALRGLGENNITLWANLFGHYVIGFAIAIVFGYGLGLGVEGLWWGLSAGLSATAAVLALTYIRRTRSS